MINRQLSPLDDAALGAALRDLGPALAAPPADELPARVTAAITARPARRSATWPSLRIARLALVAALLALLALAAIAVGSRLGLPGLSLVLGPGPSVAPVSSPPPGAPLGSGLDLGRRVTLDEARATVAFAIPLPAETAYGPPDAIWLDPRIAGGQVTLVWGPASGRPAADAHGVSLLVSAYAAEPGDRVLAKALISGNPLAAVTVNGERAFWIEGAHTLYVERAESQTLELPVRLAGDVLVWRRDGVTVRLEGDLARDEAIRIAEGMVEAGARD